jgi:hypothetical protein
VVNIGRESCIMPELSKILENLTECIEKLFTECHRVGAIPKKVRPIYPSPNTIGLNFSLKQIATLLQTITNLFNSISRFIAKYGDEPFNVLSYLNMNRIAKAERMVDAAHEKMKSLLKLSFVLRV